MIDVVIRKKNSKYVFPQIKEYSFRRFTMPHRLLPPALLTAAAVATAVAPEPVPDQAFVGPARSPTALRHLRQSAAWLDAVRPMMRLKIRRWLQFRLRKVGRDADGRSCRTIDPLLV